eukprot:2897095-Rhodomonas_salina.5
MPGTKRMARSTCLGFDFAASGGAGSTRGGYKGGLAETQLSQMEASGNAINGGSLRASHK